MNKIGINQCKDILDSFAWDSTGYKESAGIRAREREDSHIFYFRDWFNIVTARGLREGRCFKIYQNGFAPKRNKFDEPGYVSLCCFDHQAFNNLFNDKERAQFLAKFFASQKYTREQRELYLLKFFSCENFTKSRIKNFLTDYFTIERYYSKKEQEQFLAKCYDECYERKQSAKKQLIAKDVKKSKSLTKSSREECLIAKEVRRCTNLGEDYNRESLYDTVEDYLQNGKDLVIEPSKQAQADAVVNYLKYLNLEQRIIQLHAHGLELNTEENALQDEIGSLQQKLNLLQEKLNLLQEKHRAKQQERSNLQQEENKLQQEQDDLLR